MSCAYEKLGLLCIAVVAFQILRFITRVFYKNIIAVSLRINAVNFDNVGRWAVVTGATDGIGAAYAEELARKGKNIVLISRTVEKLEAMAEKIAKEYRVETKTIVADFTKTGEIYQHIEKLLTGFDIGVLVNNVGMSYPYPDYFLELKNSDDIYQNIIHCNIFSVTCMCKVVLPMMLESGRGVIINISSIAAQIPSPMLTVYSASKAYISKFSEDLSTEYSRQGITVQCVLPGYVATKMSKIKSSTWMAPSPQKYVSEAIKTVGVMEKTTGYFPHTLLVGVLHTLENVSAKLGKWLVLRTMENIKSRALRRVRHVQ